MYLAGSGGPLSRSGSRCKLDTICDVSGSSQCSPTDLPLITWDTAPTATATGTGSLSLPHEHEAVQLVTQQASLFSSPDATMFTPETDRVMFNEMHLPVRPHVSMTPRDDATRKLQSSLTVTDDAKNDDSISMTPRDAVRKQGTQITTTSSNNNQEHVTQTTSSNSNQEHVTVMDISTSAATATQSEATNKTSIITDASVPTLVQSQTNASAAAETQNKTSTITDASVPTVSLPTVAQSQTNASAAAQTQNQNTDNNTNSGPPQASSGIDILFSPRVTIAEKSPDKLVRRIDLSKVQIVGCEQPVTPTTPATATNVQPVPAGEEFLFWGEVKLIEDNPAEDPDRRYYMF